MTITGQARLAPHTQTQLKVMANGTELRLEDLQDLLEVRVDLGVRTIGRAELTFVDRDSNLLRAKLDLGVDVVISSVEPTKVLLSGIVTGVDLDATLSGTTMTVTVADHAYKLARGRGVDTYSEQDYANVLTTIARSAGLRAQVPSSGHRLPWLLRADSQLGLVDEIAGRMGWDWTVTDKTLGVWPVTETAPGVVSTSLALGVDLLAFSAGRTGTGTTNFTVRGWNPRTKRAEQATASTRTERNGFAPGNGEPAEVLVTQGLSSTSEETAAVAKGLAAAAGRVTGRGRAHFTPGLRPGGEVTITSAGSANGTYYVREVSHHVDAGSLRTSFVVGDRAPLQLSDPWQQPSPTSSMRRHGFVVGVVDSLDDPDRLGRVRVQLVGLGETTSSAWARVLALGGGAARGLVVLPEIDDEVLVAFEDDDVRRPIVLGGLFGERARAGGPAAVEDRKVVSRHLVSRLGHSIGISDGVGRDAEYVQLLIADGKKRIKLGKDSSEIATDRTPLTISSGGASLTFDGAGGLEINATTVKITADQAVQIKGTEVKADGTGALGLSGAQVELKGSATAVVKGTQVEISGALVKIN